MVVEKRPIDKLKIQGFKTLQDVELELGRLNVLIGPNGAGKSNLVSFFHMLQEMAGERLSNLDGKARRSRSRSDLRIKAYAAAVRKDLRK